MSLLQYLSDWGRKVPNMTEPINNNSTFEERVSFFSQDYLKCCLFISRCRPPLSIFSKTIYSAMNNASHLLEDFLDSHGAKSNKNWYLYRELSAAVRHLSNAGYSQKHILSRISFYDLPTTPTFREDGEKVIEFITNSLRKISPVILDEAKRLKIPIPEQSYQASDFPDLIGCDMLPSDINDEEKEGRNKNIVRIATDFLEIVAYFEDFGFYEPYNIAKIHKIVPERVNEVELRRYEMLVHNLQSYFDTYVIYGGFAPGNVKFKKFRGLFSVMLHLLQVMGRLLHFYERHLYEAGYKDIYKKVKTQLSFLVNTDKLLECTVNYGLYYLCHFVEKGKSLAYELLNASVARSAVKVGIPKDRGFHCRPSLLVAKVVHHYGGQVALRVGTDSFDASSVLELQYAGGKIQQEKIDEVVFEGDDRALKDLKLLSSVNYGEDSFGKGRPLPKELQYLTGK